MDFHDNPEQAEFRREVRGWLAKNAKPLVGRPTVSRRLDAQEGLKIAKEWQARKADAGYACMHFPKPYGGQGRPILHTVIYEEEEARFDVPSGFFEIGLGMCAPVLMQYASEEQKRRFVPPMVRGEEVWCQLFSEPGAGSDLAGLRMRAEQQGDEWIVNGQKVWTSGAHYSDYGILVTRHDPSLAKHKGLTFFFHEMRSPGIEVRPIRQIAGGSNFNEVYFTNVRIPDAQRLGQIGEGWQVSITTLMNERLAVGGAPPPDAQELVNLARAIELEHGSALEDGAVREAIADWYVQAEGLRLIRARTMTALSRGQTPGPEASITKVVSANKLQAISSFGADLLDMAGVLTSPDETLQDALFQTGYLYAPGLRIAGGSDEILRNVIAERVLGLPGDVRVDRDVPFTDVPSGR
ncbi:MAG TPA: acyl-CoA dehydrogenase family protein [Thermoanaerobaculia bacterium]|nr:acyl-CoA dehydrogenase family protein [Thermoanaerobaculia bacterium]